MITVENIRKTFKSDFWSKPQLVLDNIGFEIKEGELIGFLGVNGAGKTTFLKILLDFIKADSGKITFSPELGRSKSEILSNVGFLPERPYFYPYLKGIDFLHLIGELNSINKKVCQERIERWTKRLNIHHAMNKLINDYSKGMLQRIGFAAVLLTDPKVIFLDEPLAGLDPIGRKEFKDIMREINAEGKTVFFSSHIVNDVEEVCNRVIVLEKGGIIYDGLISSLMKENQSSQYRSQVIIDNDYQFSDKYQSTPIEGGVTIVEFDQENKNDFLEIVNKNNLELMSIHPKYVTLEEIIYRLD